MIWAMMANETSAFHLITLLSALIFNENTNINKKNTNNLPFRTKKID